jgi:uncharacterized protein (TIGR03643 family)
MSNHKIYVSEIIEIACYYKKSHDGLYVLTGLSESKTIKLMRNNLKQYSFRLWRKHVTGRKAKHKKIGATE